MKAKRPENRRELNVERAAERKNISVIPLSGRKRIQQLPLVSVAEFQDSKLDSLFLIVHFVTVLIQNRKYFRRVFIWEGLLDFS